MTAAPEAVSGHVTGRLAYLDPFWFQTFKEYVDYQHTVTSHSSDRNAVVTELGWTLTINTDAPELSYGGLGAYEDDGWYPDNANNPARLAVFSVLERETALNHFEDILRAVSEVLPMFPRQLLADAARKAVQSALTATPDRRPHDP